MGSPRVCDLYSLHPEVHDSFQRSLLILSVDHLSDAIRALWKISRATTTWVQGTRDGPLTLDVLLSLCLNTATSDLQKQASSEMLSELFTTENQSGEFYDTHAHDHLLLSRIHISAGKRMLAESTWLRACEFLGGYGFHKDVTAHELVYAIEELAIGDRHRARFCLKMAQPIVEGVITHTDGKETRHLIHHWVDLAAKIHPAGAMSYLARSSIADLPCAGGLDHAIPLAIEAIEGPVPPLTKAAAWLALGQDSGTRFQSAIADCEVAVASDSKVGRAVWQAVIASLLGDSSVRTQDLADAMSASAARLGISELGVPLEPRTAKREKEVEGVTVAGESSPDMLGAPVFPTGASPCQIVQSVRTWRDARSAPQGLDAVVNALGWKMIEMLEGGDPESAEMVITRLARDLRFSDRDPLLTDLAHGLALRGHKRLASLATALAYTCTWQRWLRHGGSPSQFLRAIELDREVAWATLAEEIAQRIAHGGSGAAVGRLVGVLVAAGRIEDAFCVWESALGALLVRVPRTGPQDDISVVYDSGCENAPGMLACVIAARLNKFIIHEKRLALAAGALVARTDPQSFAYCLRLAVTGQAPPWTMIILLQLLSGFEEQPYPGTHEAREELDLLAGSNFISAKILAKALLERAGLSPPFGTSLQSAKPPTAATDVTMRKVVDRIETVKSIWPTYGEQVELRLEELRGSQELRRRMQRVGRRFPAGWKKRSLENWFPYDEDVERCLQEAGGEAALRTPGGSGAHLQEEIEVGTILLRDVGMAVRVALSRTVRPEYVAQFAADGSGDRVCEPILIRNGEFAGWVIAGFRETELAVGEGYAGTVEAELERTGGIVFALSAELEPGSLPLTHGDAAYWQLAPRILSKHQRRFRGPLSGLDYFQDPFGVAEILTPHPITILAGRLACTAVDHGLTLVDSRGDSAVVSRGWLEDPFGEEDADQEHRRRGSQLLVRPDIFEDVCSRSPFAARFVTVVRHMAR